MIKNKMAETYVASPQLQYVRITPNRSQKLIYSQYTLVYKLVIPTGTLPKAKIQKGGDMSLGRNLQFIANSQRQKSIFLNFVNHSS